MTIEPMGVTPLAPHTARSSSCLISWVCFLFQVVVEQWRSTHLSSWYEYNTWSFLIVFPYCDKSGNKNRHFREVIWELTLASLLLPLADLLLFGTRQGSVGIGTQEYWATIHSNSSNDWITCTCMRAHTHTHTHTHTHSYTCMHAHATPPPHHHTTGAHTGAHYWLTSGPLSNFGLRHPATSPKPQGHEPLPPPSFNLPSMGQENLKKGMGEEVCVCVGGWVGVCGWCHDRPFQSGELINA